MATVFDQIQAALSGNDATVRVNGQTGNLLGVGTLVDALSGHPPAEVANLRQAFGSISLPDFPLAAFVTRIGEIRDALPTDTGATLSTALAPMAQIDGDLGGALAASLRSALEAFEKVGALTDLRFSCPPGAAGTAGGGGGAGGGAGGSGSGSGGGGSPPAPTADQPTRVAAASTEAHAVLDRMPTPFNVRTLLTFLHGATVFRREPRVPAVIPLFDDLRDPLETIIEWESLTPAQVLARIEASLVDADAFVRTGIESTLGPLLADLTSFMAGLPSADLQRIAERITIRLGELRTAVQAGDVGATGPAVSEINALLDEYDALRPTLTPLLAGVPALRTRLVEVAGDLDLGMAGMVGVLKPGGSALTRIPALHVDALDRLRAYVQGIADWLQDVVSILDLSVIEGPIGTVATGVESVADGLQSAITTITVDVQSVFTQIESLLDTLDPAAMQAEVAAAVGRFRDALVQRIGALVGPARNAVMQAVAAIDQAVDAFDPGDVVAAITDAIDALAAVLGEGEVGQAIAAVHDGLESVANQLSSVTFTPTADSVISVMDGLRSALEAIDPALLPKPATDALKSAASVLPSDLEPITDPIVDTFGEIVDEGPTPLLDAVREAPKQLLAAVRTFDPDALVGEELSSPFRDVVREMEKFRPSKLLTPVEKELKAFKEQLRRAANPAQAAQALQASFDDVAQAIHGFDPDALIEPLDDALSAVTEKLFDILPVDDTFDVLDSGLVAMQRVLDTVDSTVGLIRRVHDAANALIDVRAQLEAWVDEVLDKVDAIADTSSLAPRLAALRASVDGTKAAAIGPRFTTGSATPRAALDLVNGKTRLASLIQAHRAVDRAALLALPGSAQKTAVQAVLNRFDPLLPDFGAPWQKLGDLRQSLVDGGAELQVLLSVWDDRFHFPGSTLDELAQAQATTAQLRAWAQESLEAQFIAPVSAVFGFLEPARQLLDAFAVPLEDLAETVRNRLAAVLTGPQSLTAIRTSLGRIADLVQGLDLEFLRTSLRDLFTNIGDRLDAVSPQKLAQALDQSFGAVLDAITIDLVLPKSDLKQLDDTYADVVAKLRLLDPATIVAEVVKPLFEEKVVPLIDNFDIAPFLDTIIEKLGGLDDELRAELKRVNDAYRKLLAALPEGANQGASVSVSVAA